VKYLVAYVTKTGTTRDFASRIAKVLEEKGNAVEVKALGDTSDLSAYDRLVIGGPINGMKPHPDLQAFVESKAAASGKPFDLFAVSYLFENGRAMWKTSIRKGVEGLAVKSGAASWRIFGGKIDAAFPGFVRFMFGTPKDLPLDIRNWDAIEDFARSLP
jgi:menaquinone-dependent protoporphyrinogen IX oxidase